jgi:WD40 repeat protein
MQKFVSLAVCFSILLVGYLQAEDVPFIELKGHTDIVYSAAFSPDGKRIVTGSADKTIRIWNAESGEELKRIGKTVMVFGASVNLSGHTDRIYSVTLSPDGKKILSGSWDNTTRIWDAETGKELKKMKHASSVFSVAFSPDGKKVVTGGRDKIVRIWDAETGKELKKLEGHTDCVSYVVFSPDGKQVFTWGYDRTTRTWDADTDSANFGMELKKVTEYTGLLPFIAFSPNGKKVVMRSFDEDTTATASILDAEVGKEWKEGAVGIYVPTPDGDFRAFFEPKRLEGHTDCICSVAFSSDGKKVLTGSADNTARIWTLE